MQNIVAQIITRCETTATFQHISDVAPFFEIDPHWNHQASEGNNTAEKELSARPSIHARFRST